MTSYVFTLFCISLMAWPVYWLAPAGATWRDASWLALSRYFFLPSALALGLFSNGIQFFNVPSGSMLPNFTVGHKIIATPSHVYWRHPVLLSPLGERRADVHVGDVVLSLFPKSSDVHYLKRVVAKGGDTLSMDSTGLTLNRVHYPFVSQGQRMIFNGKENQLYDVYRVAVGASKWDVVMHPDKELMPIPLTVIPQGAVYLLGDNLTASTDSRQIGPVDIRFMVDVI